MTPPDTPAGRYRERIISHYYYSPRYWHIGLHLFRWSLMMNYDAGYEYDGQNRRLTIRFHTKTLEASHD